MAENVTRPREFRLEEVADSPPPDTSAQTLQSAAIQTLLLALSTLAQKTLIAISKLFTLLTVGSVFWLWMSIPDPNANQLTAFGMYATFVLVVNWLALRRAS